jgi:hypothetical protein
MATLVGRFQPPAMPVSMTDGRRQVQFDTPADLVDYLDNHPEVMTRIAEFSWTTLPVTGDH